MADTDTPKFHFWRFFFSLKGRVSRRAYAAFVIPQKLILWGAHTSIVHWRSHLPMQAVLTASLILDVTNLILTWPNFAVYFKRLHDFRLTGKIALLVFLPLGLALSTDLVMARLIPAWLMLYHEPYQWMLYGLLAFTLILCFIPGTKGMNRYGPPPRGPQTHAADAF